LLYEKAEEKVRGTALILQLSRNPDNLEELSQNEVMLGALARVLREEWSQSIELATNIVYIFFCFSSFTDFHGILQQHKIGATCMTIAESEVKKYEKLRADVTKRKKKAAEDKGNSEANKDYEKRKKQLIVLGRKQDQFFRGE
jgi:hypothetical protein